MTEAELEALDGALDGVCLLERDAGPCPGAVLRWYHDADLRRCHSFQYGGCGGNANKFLSQAECQRRCSPKPRQRWTPDKMAALGTALGEGAGLGAGGGSNSPCRWSGGVGRLVYQRSGVIYSGRINTNPRPVHALLTRLPNGTA